MRAQQPRLAKLTRPRPARAVPREGLFACLDEVRTHSRAICVVGPPGAGKTTLATSWLDARSIKGIWHQVDAGDADLPIFFHYLGQAAVAFTHKRQRPRPALTPEYLHAQALSTRCKGLCCARCPFSSARAAAGS
jgi:ATP/maltotriose-dependent transcriptional regulator MalT